MTPSGAGISEASHPTYLVGYGTLLNEGSLARHAEVPAEFTQVMIPGYKRVFNMRPEHYEPSEVLGGPAIENGAMNIRPRPGAWLNAVAFAVSAGDLARLDSRERYYARVEVPILSFGDGRSLGTAHAYSAPDDSPWVVHDPDALMPRWLDIELGRSGAYRLSREFGRMFDATTYLADGITLVTERYAGLLPTPDELLDAGP